MIELFGRYIKSDFKAFLPCMKSTSLTSGAGAQPSAGGGHAGHGTNCAGTGGTGTGGTGTGGSVTGGSGTAGSGTAQVPRFVHSLQFSSKLE